MADLNKVMIIGRLGQDPDIRYMPNGKAVANLSVATSYKTSTTESTEWHRVVFYERLAEVAGEYLTKGRQVYIEGRLKTRKWQDKEGNDRYTTEIVGYRLDMLGSRDEQSAPQTSNEQRPPSGPGEKPEFDDDIPF